MIASEVFSSSSSTVLNCNPDDCQRIADFVERQLVTKLKLHISEAIGNVFVAEAAKWSAHLRSSLQCMEQALMDERNAKLSTSASVAADAWGNRAAIAGSGSQHVGDRRETFEHHPLAPHSACESECSSMHSRTPPTWRKPSNLRGQSRGAPQLIERDIGSIERRLANDIFAAKLVAPPDESQESFFAGRADHRTEPGLASGIGKGSSFSSSIGPSFQEVDESECRSPSLQAFDSETPRNFEVSLRASMTLKSASSLESQATLQAKRWSQATSRLHDAGLNHDGELKVALVRTFVKFLPRLLGVLPWNPCYKLSSMLYQAFIAFVAVYATATITRRLFEQGEDDHSGILETCALVVLSGGALLGLCSCLFYNKQIVFGTSLLESYAAHTHVGDDWDKQSFKDTFFVIVLVVSCIVVESYHSGGRVEGKCAVVFAQLLIFTMTSQVLRFSRCLCFATDAYCSEMGEHTNLEHAVQEWFLLHATCRSVCESIELCFVVLQFVAIGVIIVPFLLMVHAESFAEIFLLPDMVLGVACAIMILHLSVSASSFTHKCERVPALILSFCLGDFDANRMYLVEYIERSRTAFYIFNVRVSSGIVLKTLYVAAAAAFSLASKAFMDQPLQ